MIGLVAWIAFVGLVTVIAILSIELSGSDFHAFGLPASAATGSVQRSPADYATILQRPLFSRSRQAVTQILSAPAPAPPLISDRNIALKGVFINGATAKAFLTSTQNPLGIWIENNGEIAGWRVVAISPDQVVINAQNENMVIQLHIKEDGGSLLNSRASLSQQTDAIPARFLGKMAGPDKRGMAHGAQVAAPASPRDINGGEK